MDVSIIIVKKNPLLYIGYHTLNMMNIVKLINMHIVPEHSFKTLITSVLVTVYAF